MTSEMLGINLCLKEFIFLMNSFTGGSPDSTTPLRSVRKSGTVPCTYFRVEVGSYIIA